MKHQDFYRAVVNSFAWQAWEKVAHEHGFDWHESTELNWLSDKHFATFLDWHGAHTYSYTRGRIDEAKTCAGCVNDRTKDINKLPPFVDIQSKDVNKHEKENQ